MLYKTSSRCMLPATCPYIGCMWTLPTTICCPSCIDPLRNPPINEDLAMREVQRQQAIQDLEALLQPGALEARIPQVCATGRKNGFTSVCQGVQMWCKFGALNLN